MVTSLALFLIAVAVHYFVFGLTPPRDPLASVPPPVAPVAAEFDWDAEIREQMARDAMLFAQDPTAFWNDPMRYGGIPFPQPKARDQFDNRPLFYGFVRVPGQTVVQYIDPMTPDLSQYSDADLARLSNIIGAAGVDP